MAAKKRVQSPRERRVTKVLDAARELFATRGDEATLVAEIAESAYVAPATIWNYFSTKPNLLMELALRHVRAALPERRVDSKLWLRRLVPPFTLRPPPSRRFGADSRRESFGRDY
jgi:AcrR family transcriptional regulator